VTTFNYSQTDTPDDVVRAVAAEMSGRELKPLSDQERLERELWREEQALVAKQRRFEYEQRQAEQAAEAEAVARHEAALEQAERNRVARLELQERQRERQRESEILDLRLQAAQQRDWINNVEVATRVALAQRQRTTLLGELEKMLSPPAPEPEQVTIASDDLGSPNIADDDFNAGYWLQKPIFRR
jgi:hypothetical protein